MCALDCCFMLMLHGTAQTFRENQSLGRTNGIATTEFIKRLGCGRKQLGLRSSPSTVSIESHRVASNGRSGLAIHRFQFVALIDHPEAVGLPVVCVAV
jgi:hypothetical protein